MARLLTWDDVFEYAAMQSSLSEEILRSSFDQILQRTKKTCPMKKSGLSGSEIHWNAEIQWWNSLCLGIQFPRANLEIDIADKEEPSLIESLCPTPPEKKVFGYASRYSFIMSKAVRMGYTSDYIISLYRSNLDQAMDSHLKRSGHAVAQFNGEMGWWRNLFPNDVFIGIDPVTGGPNLQTGNDLVQQNPKVKSSKRKAKLLPGISVLEEAARIKKNLIKRRVIRSCSVQVPRQKSKTLSPSPPPKPAPAKPKLKLQPPFKPKRKPQPQPQNKNQNPNQSQLQDVQDSPLSSDGEDNHHLSDTELLTFPCPPSRPGNYSPTHNRSPTLSPAPSLEPADPHLPNNNRRARTWPPEGSYGTETICMKQKRTRSLDASSGEDGVNENVESIMRNLKKMRRGTF